MRQWRREQRIDVDTLPAEAFVLRPPSPKVTVELVSALASTLDDAVPDPVVVIDLREAETIEHEAVEALVVLDRILHDHRDGGLWVRVTTTGQVEACADAAGSRLRLLLG